MATQHVVLPAGWTSAIAANGKTYFVNVATGKSQWTPPVDAQGMEAPRSAQAGSAVPGLTFITAGFDIIEMAGRKGAVFQFGPSTVACEPPVAHWRHPAEIQYQPRSEREVDLIDVDTQVSSDKMVSGTIGGKALAFASLNAGFSTSKSVSISTRRMLYADIQYISQLSLLHTPQQLVEEFLHPLFAEHGNNLPIEYNEESYRDFIRTYGTHYARRVQLGGAKYLSLEVDSSTTTSEKELRAEISSEVNQMGGSIGGSRTSKSSESQSRYSSQLRISGGDTTLKDDTMWRASLFRYEPFPFPVDVRPLAELLPEPKKEHLARAVREYAMAHFRNLGNAPMKLNAEGFADGKDFEIGVKDKLPVPGTKITNLACWHEIDSITGISLLYNYNSTPYTAGKAGEERYKKVVNLRADEYLVGIHLHFRVKKPERAVTEAAADVSNKLQEKLSKEWVPSLSKNITLLSKGLLKGVMFTTFSATLGQQEYRFGSGEGKWTVAVVGSKDYEIKAIFGRHTTGGIASLGAFFVRHMFNKPQQETHMATAMYKPTGMNHEEMAFSERDYFIEDRMVGEAMYGWNATNSAYGIINRKLVSAIENNDPGKQSRAAATAPTLLKGRSSPSLSHLPLPPTPPRPTSPGAARGSAGNSPARPPVLSSVDSGSRLLPPRTVATPPPLGVQRISVATDTDNTSVRADFSIRSWLAAADIKPPERVEQYAAVFEKNEVDASILELLDNATLESWGISVGADRLRLLKAAKAFQT